ncbi:DegQ family serine endoprotease [Skermanella stibiiresistens]|uniref:DegQ family serine endoprotease n=1 Tax=Skermanella stibiiresistens TaxID=913326 RepID=UPI0004BCED23|nr:DegQ family serine endoprotease [Skermanella stibiiresistens]
MIPSHHRQHRAGVGRRLLALPLAVFIGAAGLGSPVPASAQSGPPGFADLAEEQIKTVVNISTTQTRGQGGPTLPGAPPGRGPGQGPGPGGPRGPGGPGGPDVPEFPPGSPFEEFFRQFREQQPSPRPVTALGSGFIIDSSGLVVTNNHVVADADQIQVTLHDDTVLDAELVGNDPLTDLALLRIKTDKPLPAARWGDSNKMRIGDWVMAIGNPFGLGGTVTTGILSARARDINQGPYDEFLQTDASINRGNSGGPLFNMAGEVIGINTAIFSPTGGSIGIGFAVPSSLASPVLDQIRDHGKPRRGWLGVQIQGVTPEIAESLQLPEPRGALVTTVTGGGPAEKAGIKQGDVILKFNGQDVDAMRQLPRLVADTPIGQQADVVIQRAGENQTIKVTVGDMDAAQQAAATTNEPTTGGDGGNAPETTETLGMTLAPLDATVRQAFSIPDTVEGVVVTDSAQDSPAAGQGIAPGDVIVEVGQEPVKSPDDVTSRIDKAREAGRKNVLMLLSRGGELRFVPLPLEG